MYTIPALKTDGNPQQISPAACIWRNHILLRGAFSTGIQYVLDKMGSHFRFISTKFWFYIPIFANSHFIAKNCANFSKVYFFQNSHFCQFSQFFSRNFPSFSSFPSFLFGNFAEIPIFLVFPEFRELNFPFCRIPILSRKITQPKQCQIPILSNSHFIKNVL